MATGTREPDEKTRDAVAIPRILAIVVTHNGRRWLKDCLVSLEAQTYPALNVLVVDDASPDTNAQPTLKRIAKRHLRRRKWGYLRTPRPLGYGGAINWTLSRVRADVDFLLFLHDDVALETDAVERLVIAMVEDPKTAVVGPKVVSWDDPGRLEEVGMAADRFGYPYKGLEEGEIDLGQHDSAGETFYVTSTCMLVRPGVFRQLRGWDARLRAFAEDLDLCWRVRLAGHSVRVEPTARARHAIAMARGERSSPFEPPRYFIRRNRLRTVFKNVAGLRLLVLVPQFVMLTLAEMIGFIVLRQPGEIWNLARALGWNFLRLPQTFTERVRVQRIRRIPDKVLRRHTVKQSTRVRAYVTHQRDRLEEAWGRRTELVATRSKKARVLTAQMKGWLGVAAFLAALSLVLGFRDIWWSPQISVGDILPFPDRPGTLWRAYFSPWRGVGLGEAGPMPPALALLGIFPLLTLGAAGAAQKLLILTMGLLAFAGAYRLVADLVDRAGRFAAGAAYMLGAVGYAGVRQGALGALVFGAAAPFAVRSLIRLAGWARPSGWSVGRATARTTLACAISAAFVPGSLFLYALVVLVLAAARRILVRGDRGVSGVLRPFVGLAGAWAILLPWSATWFSEGGPLALLWSDSTSGPYAASYAGHDALSVILGQTPEVPPLLGLSLPIVGVVAIVIAHGQRRRLALALWAVLGAIGLVVAATSTGLLRPLVASPTEAGVIASLAFATLVGIAVGAARLDLPRRRQPALRWMTLAVFAGASFLALYGLGPALFRGAWTPGAGTALQKDEVVDQVRSLLGSEVSAHPEFRALWVGRGWGTEVPTSATPETTTFLTGPRGQSVTDIFERRSGVAGAQFQRVIDSVERGTTDRGGALLGAFNVQYVVIARGPEAEPWLDQRDLRIVRAADDYFLMENEGRVARAGLYQDFPISVRAVDQADPAVTAAQAELELESLEPSGPNSYYDEDASGPGLVFLAEANDPGWEAKLGGQPLPRVHEGWGNAFEIPSDRRGPLELRFEAPPTQIAWHIWVALSWIVVVGASFSRRRTTWVAA